MSHNLVLSRRAGQSVGIIHDGEPMGLTVVGIEGDKVRLMFTAPLSYRIVRAELVADDRVPVKEITVKQNAIHDALLSACKLALECNPCGACEIALRRAVEKAEGGT